MMFNGCLFEDDSGSRRRERVPKINYRLVVFFIKSYSHLPVLRPPFPQKEKGDLPPKVVRMNFS